MVKMARKKQTRRTTKNKRFPAKKASSKDENKPENKESKEDVNTEAPVAENTTVSSQEGKTEPCETGKESETGLDLKRKREETASDIESNSEDIKKMKGENEEQVVKEVSIRIERCNSWHVYKRNADKLCEELKTAFADIQVEVNPQKPRSKSFEVMLCKDEGTEIVIWSGIKKGPPRKLKFPESQVVVSGIREQLDI